MNSVFTLSICHAQSTKVSSFGTDDHTESILSAIKSANDTIIIDFIAEPWVVAPLRFSGLRNKVIVFEEGVEIWAKKGCFPNTNDALWTLKDCENIRFLGNNTTFCMNKVEYPTGEWRHGICLLGSKDIKIKNLNIRDTGGDGIYLAGGRTRKFCKNVNIENIKSINNKRQGISIISAIGVNISNSLFAETKGTLPSAGIDIEPNKISDVIQNIMVDSCVFENNYGAGVVVGLGKLTSDSKPISIIFKNCVLRNNHDIDNKNVGAEVIIGSNAESPVQGSLKFDKLYVENSNWGLCYTRKRSDAFSVEFNDCTLKDIGQKSGRTVLYFEVPNYKENMGPLGGFNFNNLILENKNQIDLLLVRGSRLGTLALFENFKLNMYQTGLSSEPIKYINYSEKDNSNVVINIFNRSVD